MKRNLLKSLLVAVGMAAGMMAFAPSEVCAQGAFKRTLVSQDYELAESPDWSFFLGPTISLVTGDATYGNYVSLIQGGGSGNRNVYKYVEFQTTPDGYLEDLSTKGYVVEFDASFVDGNHNNGIAQFLLMTSSTGAKNNDRYEGEDYIFALSQPTSTPYSESWYVNDLNNGGEPVTIASGLWHHFVITISASYVDYVITEIASGEIVAQGRKELAGSELPIIEGFRALLPRASSVYNFDNLVIYDYVAQQVATPPTIELTDINMNERTYTVTCAEGETLYYKLPGEDIFTEIEGKTSTEVTIGVSGVFSAYTMLGSSTSAVVEVNVVAEILKLNAPSYLRLGADSYYIIEASQDNIGFGPTAKLYYTINGGEAKDITGGGEITGVIGDLVVWASADGYGDSEVTIPYTPALQLSEVWAYDLDSYPRTTGITAISDAINPETKQTLNGLEVYNLSGINCPNLFVDNSSAWLLRNRTGNAFKSQSGNGTLIFNNVSKNNVIYVNARRDGRGDGVDEVVNGEVHYSYGYFTSEDAYGTTEYFIIPNENGAVSVKFGRGVSINGVSVNTISPMTVTITGAKGLATYTPSVALDFTDAQDIAAYTATVSGTTVNLTRTNTVAAGEGVLIRSLNGGPVSEDIPVASTAVEHTAGNMFVGVLEEIAQLPSEDGDNTNFILNNNGANGSGFYLANNKTVAAGKAYLRVPTESAAKISFFSLDGSITGIEGVEAEAAEGEKVYYNLKGQRVATPSNGLYILGGKKVIVK